MQRPLTGVLGMARYFFHVSNGDTFKDEVGNQFPDLKGAMANAQVIAKVLAEDDDWEGYAVVVIDEHGTEIGRVLVAG